MCKKILLLMVLGLVLVSPIFAAGAADAEAEAVQEFKINIDQEPQILDPIHFRDDKATSIILAIHEPLLRPSTDPETWEPGLATGYEVNDERTVYTFMLRKDAKWEDGTAVTADDIVFNFQSAVDPAVASEKSFDYYDILNAEAIVAGDMAVADLGVKAIDQNTVEITLRRPVDYFIDLVKSPGFAPVQKAAREANADLYGTDIGKVVASGPFKLVSWEHDAEIVLEKNENYWDAANVALGKVVISLARDVNAVVGLYETGELDFMEVASDFLGKYRDSAEFNTMPIPRVSFIEFNPGKEVLDNIKIREALSISFNRKDYVEKVLATGDLPAYGMVPPGVRGTNNGDFREQAGDIVKDLSNIPGAAEKAKELFTAGLKELGMTVKEFEDSITLQCVDSPNSKKLAQAIQQMWFKTLDLNLKVVPMQVKMLIPLLMNGTFDMVVGGGRTGITQDASYFLDFIYYENKWDDPYIMDLIEQTFVTSGDERINLLMQAEKYVLDKFIFIPQNYTVANYLVRDGVEGFRRFATGVQFDYKYINITK
ncbi:MAG: peptide ABC transporter substrate-binding protein [Bacteroidetes bacterium]|nr:peptide ABC transporter substrate-binding protein [Bacteroidota bacterium]